MRAIYQNGRITLLRRPPLRDTGHVRQALNQRITTHLPHHTDSIVTPQDGAKTAQIRPSRCLRKYPMDCSTWPVVRLQLLVSVTPEPGDKSAYLKPSTLLLCMELIRQARHQFRGVEGRTPKGLTSGISVNLMPTYHTEALTLVKRPFGINASLLEPSNGHRHFIPPIIPILARR